jgi:hypothetical protein
MGETIDDFIRRFGGGGEDQEEQSRQAQEYYEKFVSRKPEDEEFNREQFHQGATEYLGKLPDDQFQQAASQSYSQMEPQEQQGLVTSLLAALKSNGVNLDSVAQTLGMGQTDPQNMNADEYAKLANYTRHEHPEAMQQVVAEKPWFVKALGNPVVLGALGMIAAKWLRSRSQQDQ